MDVDGASGSEARMRLDAANIHTLHPARVFNDSTMQIAGMDFHSDGKLLLIASLDDSLTLYNCETGLKVKSINSKKYGVGQIRFDKDENFVLQTSTKLDNTIRYLSLLDNKYLRYFLGHTKEVISLQVSPLHNVFGTSSRDKTARIWDLRLNNCQGMINFTTENSLSFDPEGLIFAAASAEEESVKLFDMRNFDKGPFAALEVKNPVRGSAWHEIKFSCDGSLIMLNSNANYSLALESLETGPVQMFTGIDNDGAAKVGATFTPCGKFALVGTASKHLNLYEVDRNRLSDGSDSFESAPFETLHTPNHIGMVGQIVVNPKYMMLAVASQVLEFWIPELPERS